MALENLTQNCRVMFIYCTGSIDPLPIRSQALTAPSVNSACRVQTCTFQVLNLGDCSLCRGLRWLALRF